MRKGLILMAVIIVIGLFRGNGYAFVQTQHVPQSIELKEVEDYFDGFLNAWLIEQDIEKVRTFYIDAHDHFFMGVLEDMFKVSGPGFDYDTWLTKTILMWLEADHGIVSNSGHGDPAHSEYVNMPIKPEDLKNRLRWQNTDEAIEKTGVAEYADGLYIGFVVLKHVPKDSLLFLMRRVGDQWNICGYMWIVG